MLSQDKITCLEFSLVPGVGAITFKKLIDKFSNPANVFKADLIDLLSVEGISKKTADNIIKGAPMDILDKQLKLIDKYGVDIITASDSAYPENLKFIYGAPQVLFVKGDILPDDYFSIAIIGTRQCSFYGREMASRLGRELVERGMTIVSGGARGIDTQAHTAALKAGGRTIAVLGCGLDVAYPKENKKLFEDISKNGVLISEFPMGTPPDKGNFPMRNRIVSGLSLGVVVIEAPKRSGALITARLAIEQGKEVFSVPGAADKFNSCGSNQLLRDGAKLVESADDVLEELQPLLRHKINEIKLKKNKSGSEAAPNKHNSDLTADEEKVYGLLSAVPAHIDDILLKCGLSMGLVFGALTQLELKKMIKQLPGKRFVTA